MILATRAAMRRASTAYTGKKTLKNCLPLEIHMKASRCKAECQLSGAESARSGFGLVEHYTAYAHGYLLSRQAYLAIRASIYLADRNGRGGDLGSRASNPPLDFFSSRCGCVQCCHEIGCS